VFLFWTLATLLVSVLPVSADNVAVGVKAGDWMKYGEISVTWWSSSIGPAPQHLVDLNNTEWIKIEVQNVLETKATAMKTKRFKNGTEKTETPTWNITSLWWNPENVFIIEANLSKGNSTHIYTARTILKVTNTVSRKYAGATREVNHINTTVSGVSWGLVVDAYWDKTTGILCELHATEGAVLPGRYSNATLNMTILDTNLWQPSPIWMEPWFWVITLVIVAAVAVPAIWVWRRRKMPPHKEEAVSAPSL